MSSRSVKGEELFQKGYNCAQSVVLAFEDELLLDEAVAARIASPFGGGIGMLREVCGAFTGSVMALGMLRGVAEPRDRSGRRALYADVQRLADRFVEEHGSLICGELLGMRKPVGERHICKKPCSQMVADAIAVLDEVLSEEENADSAHEW